MSPFLTGGDFHAHSHFARPTIPEEKWGTTRSLEDSSVFFFNPDSRWNGKGGMGFHLVFPEFFHQDELRFQLQFSVFLFYENGRCG